MILDLELNGEESQKREKGSAANHWFMISSEWLFKWKCFVTNKISKAINQEILHEINQSVNKKIGILPPGPITNYKLFELEGIVNDTTMFSKDSPNVRDKGNNSKQMAKPEIKDNLVIELDYKTVKRDVWSKFITIYGGGPSIVREKPEIYSTPVEENLIPAAGMRVQSPPNNQRVKKQASREKDTNVGFGAHILDKKLMDRRESRKKAADQLINSKKT